MCGFRMLPITAALGISIWCQDARAEGTLTPETSGHAPIELTDHRVRVVINNGFSRTEVTQTFHNPNATELAATYEFPVPPKAALSEMTILAGDDVLQGEVVDRARAEQLYAQQVATGQKAGLAVQNGYQNFRFSVARVPALGDTTVTFVYYEAVTVDTGVGRYLYPLERGGTDDGRAFWTGEATAVARFSFDLELKSAAPVADVRVPDVPHAAIAELGPGHYTVHFDAAPSTLDRDVVAYYKLQNDLPGRVEVIPHRARGAAAGTFMLVVTPGIDLAPIEHGTDHVYVLDFSGSMSGKIDTLKEALALALAELSPQDRFRLVGFADHAFDITPGFVGATAENVANAAMTLAAQGVLGSTNLYDGLGAAFSNCDSDRVTSVFLVTDGVTNTGVVDPPRFESLLRTSDVRVFGFLMGNSANWPLMQIITETSGGFYAPVSNQDDILGQVLLAKSKLGHESLHDARLELTGAEVWDTTDFGFGKVYRGEQLVVFGRYAPGNARMTLRTKIRGQAKEYSTAFALPETAEHSPELERLWALDMIQAVQRQRLLGLMPDADARATIRRLGLEYQLVTEETAMIVLESAAFTENGVDRTNSQRTQTEHRAQASSATQPPQSHDVGGEPFPSSSSSLDGDAGHGGALDATTVAFLLLSLLAFFGARPRKDAESA